MPPKKAKRKIRLPDNKLHTLIIRAIIQCNRDKSDLLRYFDKDFENIEEFLHKPGNALEILKVSRNGYSHFTDVVKMPYQDISNKHAADIVSYRLISLLSATVISLYKDKRISRDEMSDVLCATIAKTNLTILHYAIQSDNLTLTQDVFKLIDLFFDRVFTEQEQQLLCQQSDLGFNFLHGCQQVSPDILKAALGSLENLLDNKRITSKLLVKLLHQKTGFFQTNVIDALADDRNKLKIVINFFDKCLCKKYLYAQHVVYLLLEENYDRSSCALWKTIKVGFTRVVIDFLKEQLAKEQLSYFDIAEMLFAKMGGEYILHSYLLKTDLSEDFVVMINFIIEHLPHLELKKSKWMSLFSKTIKLQENMFSLMTCYSDKPRNDALIELILNVLKNKFLLSKQVVDLFTQASGFKNHINFHSAFFLKGTACADRVSNFLLEIVSKKYITSEEFLTILYSRNIYGENFLTNACFKESVFADALKFLFHVVSGGYLSGSQVMEFLKNKNNYGMTIFMNVAKNDNNFKLFLNFMLNKDIVKRMPKDFIYELLKLKNKENYTSLHAIIKNNNHVNAKEFFKFIMESLERDILTKEQLIELFNDKTKAGFTFISMVPDGNCFDAVFPVIKNMLQKSFLSSPELFMLFKQQNKDGFTFLHNCMHADSSNLEKVLLFFSWLLNEKHFNFNSAQLFELMNLRIHNGNNFLKLLAYAENLPAIKTTLTFLGAALYNKSLSKEQIFCIITQIDQGGYTIMDQLCKQSNRFTRSALNLVKSWVTKNLGEEYGKRLFNTTVSAKQTIPSTILSPSVPKLVATQGFLGNKQTAGSKRKAETDQDIIKSIKKVHSDSSTFGING